MGLYIAMEIVPLNKVKKVCMQTLWRVDWGACLGSKEGGALLPRDGGSGHLTRW